ncbi:MAG TPA: hypothetical protein VFI95_25580 [Terriglobales bacterium]|nr:hypothetical protein [Terriglobales bacterium]
MKPHFSPLRILALFLVLCPGGVAQRLPEAPSHNYWDTRNKMLFLIHAGVEATDFVITHHNLSRGGREMNPLGKSLCESGTAGQVSFFAIRTGGTLGASYLFHWTGHHKLERVVTMFMISDSAYGATYSFAHRR